MNGPEAVVATNLAEHLVVGSLCAKRRVEEKHLEKMVNQNMLCMYEGNFLREKKTVCLRSDQMPFSDQITEVIPFVLTPSYFGVTISYTSF